MEEPESERAEICCPICQKSWTDNNSRRARSKHISYCRKKRRLSAVSRRKACDECVRAKTRCSLDPAGCSRCTSKDHPCTFRGRLSLNPDFDNEIPAAAGNGFLKSKPAKIDGLRSEDILNLSLGEQAAPVTDMLSGMSPLAHSTLAWDNDYLGARLSDEQNLMLSLDANYNLGVDFETEKTSVDVQNASCTENSTRARQPSPSILASLSYKDPASILERRNFSQPDLQVTGDLALHILRSYLYAMAEQDTVPPFVHPKYQDLVDISASRPSPLYATKRLSKMLFLGRRMNRNLIWRLIRMEQERMLNEHTRFDKWEILEALQSMVIYILMRIVEGRHDYTNFDTQLLITLNAICGYITTNFGMLISSKELKGEMIPWEDWVFLESRRRSATVFVILDSIFHAQIWEKASTMPEYTVAPAPSPRALWDAENGLDWATGYADYLHANATHGMLKNGDLVALKEEHGGQNDRWYAYADSFGVLVTLAANLVV